VALTKNTSKKKEKICKRKKFFYLCGPILAGVG